jgi:toxin-antitoxin system PIN domain toxin
LIALLDVNLLLALAWPQHLHHAAADRWFARHRALGWATCPHTQLGFLRLSATPAVVGAAFPVGDGLRLFAANTAAADHVFWAEETAPIEILAEIRNRLGGPQQLADAMLLDLAIRRGGQLATLDRRVAQLLRPGSGYRRHLAIVPVG